MARKANRSKRRKNPRTESAKLNMSSLDQHHRQRNLLIPPLRRLSQMHFTSWRDSGINEVLSAILIRGNLDQAPSLTIFRDLISNARHRLSAPNDTYLTHSVLSVLGEDVFDVWAAPLLNNTVARELLRPLLFFDCLPDRSHWQRHLDPPDPAIHGRLLMKGVASCLDHQSQEATDIRWLKICYFAIVCDRVRIGLNEEQAREWIEELRLYPDYGDQRKVRPSIRAFEIGLRGFGERQRVPNEVPPALCDRVPDPWHEAFWSEAFLRTPCLPPEPRQQSTYDAESYLTQLIQIYGDVHRHFFSVATNTDVDPRLDAAFGLCLYAVSIAIGLSRGNVHRRVEGRILLRTIVEAYITLRFLSKKDDHTLWMQYRNFGVGQSKLVLLKNLREEDLPEYVNLDDLIRYANEDINQEFVDINLKPWAEKISEKWQKRQM